MTAVTTLTPRLVEDFRRNGFVVVPDLLSADELLHFGAAVDEGVARHARTKSNAACTSPEAGVMRARGGGGKSPRFQSLPPG